MARSSLRQARVEAIGPRSGVRRKQQPPALAPEPTRREVIRDEAARIFARDTYHGAALQEIADVIGLTKASIYYYYKSKDELLFDILS